MDRRLSEVRQAWEAMARDDAYWAVLSDPSKAGGRWDADAFYATGEKQVADMLAHLARLGLEVGSGTALDFGCGAGRLVRPLSRRFARVVGIDLARPMLEQARRICADRANVALLLSCHPELPLADASIDFVVCHLVLQHTGRAATLRYLGEFCRVMRPGAIGAVSVPCRLLGHASGGFRADSIPTTTGTVPMDMMAIDPAEVRATFERGGAEVVEILYEGDGHGRDDFAGYVVRRR